MEVAFIGMMIILGVAAGYIMASLFLLYNPTILHSKKIIKFKSYHISHRGGAGENLENTMAAFKHAIQLKSDMLELDCHLTKDGIVVVTHDEDLYRTTGCNHQVRQLNFQNLPPLLDSLLVEFEPHFRATGSDVQIVTLESVFREFPDTAINMDIKVNDDELIAKAHQLIKDFDRKMITVWGSRASLVADKLYQLDPCIPLLCSQGAVIRLVLLYWSGLLPFTPIRESHLEVIMPSILLHSKFSQNKIVQSWWSRLVIKVLDILLMNSRMFYHLQKRGMHVYLWVLNEEEDFARAMALGVDGIMTDFPTKLRKYLDEHLEEVASNMERTC